MTYDLLFRHTCETSLVAGLTTLLGDILNFLLRTVGEVAWVVVVCHIVRGEVGIGY